MSSQYLKATVLAASLATFAGSALAAAPADWSKVPGRTVTVSARRLAHRVDQQGHRT